MIPVRGFAGKTVAVFGLARTGLAAARALAAGGAKVALWDDNPTTRDAAVAAHHEIVLAIVGGLFVFEAASVIIQVFWYKRTGKRVFRMAPVHHHFEQLGWAESTVVIRFWIVSIVLALIGLATLKVR